MNIRPYDESDRQAVVALWQAIFPATLPHNDPMTAIRMKLEVQRELFFVATLGGPVVGTVMGGYDGHRGWIYSLAVADEQRRIGIGSALAKHVEQALAARGCLKVNLQVHGHNTVVVPFYEALGYKVEDRVSMGKVLL